ncbi:MAG TPA: phosphate acyltransferase PlsX, partial [Acidobacteriota bacterium]|nr:phosphate acyltransferase PlsX [Acidobacteriota bacterium]
ERIQEELAHHQYPADKIEVIHAPEIVMMDDQPTTAVRKKRNSSMRIAVDLATEGKADAIVSAGNTGAMYATVKFVIGALPGLDRLPLAAWFPHPTGRSIVLDVGANVDCKPRHLLEFAYMGSIFAQEIFNIPSPRIGLLNIGHEDGKGNELTRETFPLLKESELNFIGNVEGNDVFKGTADVYVCDGFIGNVALKVSESLIETIFHLLKDQIQQQPQIGKVLTRYFDYSEYGGAPLLGARIPCFVCHGKSNAKAIKNAIRVAGEFCNHRVNERIDRKISRLVS